MDYRPLGSMGVGTPMALGAAAAAQELANESGAPNRPVTLVTGDGAFGFYAMEFSSAVQNRLPLLCVIANDGGWGGERAPQLKELGRNINMELGRPRYDVMASAMGCHGELVEKPLDLIEALQRAWAAVQAGQPAVVNVITDPQAGRFRRDDPRLAM
jgi:acetolactate synthase-1/2/3 large subunit